MNNGIEKITARILDDANAQADEINAQTAAETEAVLAQYAEKAKSITNEYTEKAERIRASGVQKAESAAEAVVRASTLNTKSEVIDSAFENAVKGILSLGDKEYFAFLTSLLFSVLDDREDAQKTSKKTGDEICTSDEYLIRLNKTDSDKYAKKLVEKAKQKYPEINIRTDEQFAEIDGGLIIICGKLEANCSVSLLVKRSRESIERDVSKKLFGENY